MSKKLPGIEHVTQGLLNAYDWFVARCVERGFTPEQAQHIHNVYLRLKVMKADHIQGNYRVKHGAFWDVDVMRRALEQ